jgi:3-oxoacyl-[acyl-carrier protein] reductase
MATLNDLSSHLALITGCTGGIGQATSRSLAALHCSIAVHYNSASQDANNLVTELRDKYDVRAETFQADLSSYDGTRSLHKAIVEKMGHPTILFNNAGTTGPKTGVKTLDEISVESFESTWRTNCGSAYLLTQLCLPAMVEAKFGRVIFCSSVAGFTGGVVGPHYASSKAALHGLVHWLAGYYAKTGVTVNGVAPALIEDTKMLPGRENRAGLESSKFILSHVTLSSAGRENRLTTGRNPSRKIG